MAKFYLWFLCLLVCMATAQGQTVQNIWTGNQDNSWHNPANWSLGVVPDASMHVNIPTVPATKPYPHLSQAIQIQNLTLQPGAHLYLNGQVVQMNNFLSYWGILHADGGTLHMKIWRVGIGGHIYGNLTVYAEAGVIQGNTFHGDLTLYANTCGPCPSENWEWPMGGFMFSYGSPDRFKGNFYFNNTGSGYGIVGVFGQASPIVFEKKATFLMNSNGRPTLSLISYGEGAVIFEDTTRFELNVSDRFSYIYLRSNITFKRPVFVSTIGSNFHTGIRPIPTAQVPNPTGTIIFEDDLYLEAKESGIITIGGSAEVGTLFKSSSNIKWHGEGFKAGYLHFGNVTFEANTTPIELLVQPDSISSPFKSHVHLWSGIEFTRPIRVRADYIEVDGSIFQKDAAFTFQGLSGVANVPWPWYSWNGSHRSLGGNVFEKPVLFRNLTGRNWQFATVHPDVFMDSVRFESAGVEHGNWQIGVTGSEFRGPVSFTSTSSTFNDVTLGGMGTVPTVIFEKEVSVSGSSDYFFLNSHFRYGQMPSFTLNSAPTQQFHIRNSLFERGLSLSAPRVYVSGSRFMRPSVISKTGSGNDTSIGGNTYHGRIQLLSPSSGHLMMLSGEDRLVK